MRFHREQPLYGEVAQSVRPLPAKCGIQPCGRPLNQKTLKAETEISADRIWLKWHVRAANLHDDQAGKILGMDEKRFANNERALGLDKNTIWNDGPMTQAIAAAAV